MKGDSNTSNSKKNYLLAFAGTTVVQLLILGEHREL